MPELRLRSAALAVAALLALAACQSGEERAEAHYQRALELLAEGDFDRARVEFLNVFDNDGFHQDARAAFAASLRTEGRTQESYSQYLRLVEQYPDHVEGRLALAEMALQFRNLEEARRHGARAITLAPDDPRVAVIEVSLAYADAVAAEDGPAREAAYARAAELMAGDPENHLLLQLEIDTDLRAGDFEGALAALETNLEADPDDRLLHNLRLSLLAELGREDQIEDQLRRMLELFPEDETLPGTLLRFHLARGEADRAVEFLRARAEAAEEGNERTEALTALVRLRLETEGPEAALEEIDGIIAADDEVAVTFPMLRASILFDLGQRDTAIAELEAMLASDRPSLTEQGQIRITLARMLLSEGNPVRARALVEETLQSDPTNVEGLKMRAAWHIEEDEADRAIGLLRTALDGDPDDFEAMTLMAQAYERNGNRPLAREFLSLAVEASGSAPQETLRYATALIEEGRTLVAEELLIDALGLAPDDPELLAALGRLYIGMEDWPRAEQVVATLREAGGADRERLADGLEASRLAAQGRLEDAVALIEGAAAEAGTGDAQAQISVVRARLASGDAEGALDYVEVLVEEAPENLQYRFALGGVQSAVGDLDAAEATFREILDRDPTVQQAWIGLIRTLNGQGRGEDAEAALEEALASLPEALDLLWAQASFRERAGDIEGAIEIYELMYDRAPQSEVVANNLASLLATYRDDDESLDRAWRVARRLRGIEVPPFQDTYGWIAYRRGEYETALSHLEPAAEGLPEDPLVQYHLAMTYLALERPEAALDRFRRAVSLAGEADARPQIATAREEIARLEAAAAEQAEEAGETGQADEPEASDSGAATGAP